MVLKLSSLTKIHVNNKRKNRRRKSGSNENKGQKYTYRSVIMQGKKYEYGTYENMVKAKQEHNQDKLKELGFM